MLRTHLVEEHRQHPERKRGAYHKDEKPDFPRIAPARLACGTPLVTAGTPGSRELLVDGESALLVPPGDPAALAAAVRRLATDPALRSRVAAGGLAAYQEHASEDVLGARWKALLEGLVAGRRR